jgi:trehalose-phosphatase
VSAALRDLLGHLDAITKLLSHGPVGLFSDIDGTLSPIVADPDKASVSEGARDSLRRLSDVMTVVALTGRDVQKARSIVGLDSIIYSGNHGAQWLEDGIVMAEEAALPFAALVQGLAEDARQAFASYPGVLVEDKGLSLAVHYRATRDPDAAREAIWEFINSSDKAIGLALHEGKLVVEARSGAGLSKGLAVRTLCERNGLGAAIVIGDDKTDADAFRVVDELRRDGTLAGMNIAVLSDNTPSELLETADYSLGSIGAVEEVLGWLVSVSA